MTTAEVSTPQRLSVLDDAFMSRLAQSVAVTAERPHRDILCPFDGAVIGSVPIGTADDVDAAFERARRAQKEWAATPVKARAQILSRFHDLLFRHEQQMLDIIQSETGKARSSAFEENLHTAITARYYSNTAAKVLRPQHRHGAIPGMTATTVHHHPVGVVGVIAPWNYPLTLSVSDAIAALAAGNAIVLKPDSQTPFSALYAVQLLKEAGLPKDLFQVVTGPGSVVGTAIVESCDYLMFTGSTSTGRTLAQQASDRLIGFSAELGGKNPMIVASDADITAAVEGLIIGAFSNSGHLCVSIERLYVVDSVWDDFIPALVDRVRAMTLGAGFDWEIEMGAISSQSQLDTIEQMVADAVDKGATILTGGKARPDLGPQFYEPTLLTDIPDDAALAREEVFGPVVSVWRVADEAEAIAKANDTSYGLNASVWAKPSTGVRIATQLQAGSVNINDGYAASFASVDAPMGGMKSSGVGRRQGAEGLLRFTEAQTVTVQRIMPIAMPMLPRETYAKLAGGLMRAGKTLRILT